MFPLALVGLALAAAGTAAQMKGQAAQKTATNNAIADQLRRQAELSKAAQPVFQQQLQKSSRPQVSLAQGEARAKKGYQQEQSTQLGQFGSPVSSMTTGTMTGDALTRGQNQLGANAAAANSRWSQFQLDQAINNLIAGGQLNVISALSRNEMSPYSMQLAGAQQEAASLQGLGSLGQSIGGTLGMYAATKPSTVIKGVNVNPNARARTDLYNLM